MGPVGLQLWNYTMGLIMQGDCLELLDTLEPESFDLCITDPPYGLNYRSPWPVGTNKKDFIENDKAEDLIPLIQNVIPKIVRVMSKDSEIYWFCGGGGSPVLAWAWLEFKKFEPSLRVKNVLVWDKEFVDLGWDWRFQYETIFQLVKGKGIDNIDKSASNVIRAKKIIPQVGEHPTPKSLEIIAEIIKRKPAKNIIDPFAGSGTTLVAAKQFGINAVGIEIEPKYVEICKQRLMQEYFDFK
jgi:site-specific DNA-methyltransferase (adenine-specific)